MQGVMQDSQPPGKLHARISALAKGRLREVLDTADTLYKSKILY